MLEFATFFDIRILRELFVCPVKTYLESEFKKQETKYASQIFSCFGSSVTFLEENFSQTLHFAMNSINTKMIAYHI